jgi:hypothetical protein
MGFFNILKYMVMGLFQKDHHERIGEVIAPMRLAKMNEAKATGSPWLVESMDTYDFNRGEDDGGIIYRLMKTDEEVSDYLKKADKQAEMVVAIIDAQSDPEDWGIIWREDWENGSRNPVPMSIASK